MIWGLSFQLALQSHPDAGFLRGGPEKRLISQKRTMSVFYGTWKQIHHLDTVGFCESDLGHMCGPMCCHSEALCVCVSSGDVSLLHNTSQLWIVSTVLIPTGHCLYIIWLFPQLSHSSSLVNIHCPQMEMVLRKTAQALDLLSGQAKLETYGWSQCVCSGPLTCTYCSAMVLIHGERGPCIYVHAWRY